jgi:hypothetical protein
MMSVKDLVWGEGSYVALDRVENGSLVYNLLDKNRGPLLEFRVPHADQLGATFQLTDTPKLFMRWIRKELERQKQEEALLEEGRIAWEKELLEKEGQE